MKWNQKYNLIKQLDEIEERSKDTFGALLLRAYVNDVMASGLGNDRLEVILDDALSRQQLYRPERLSWCSKITSDNYGIKVTVPVSKKLTFGMRLVPAGSFYMGSSLDKSHEKPRHKVTITEGFWICETPCTRSLYKKIMRKCPYSAEKMTSPVDQVSLEDSLRFLDALNKVVPTLDAIIPTEAQWEHAARAGDEKDIHSDAKAVAWFSKNSKGVIHPVGEKSPNSLGLYDMFGNVCEWTSDYWEEKYRVPKNNERINPVGPTDGKFGVVRGGCALSLEDEIRPYSRQIAGRRRNPRFAGFRFCRPL